MEVKEVARRLGVTLKSVYDLVWAGRLNARKVDGKWLIPVIEVEARLATRGNDD